MSGLSELSVYSGLETTATWQKAEPIYCLLREQMAYIQQCRRKVVEMLTKLLVDQGDETTGLEYEESLADQELLYVYMTALADRCG